MKSISIIVPVYGVEKYLKRCLDSLVNQTLNDIEIILIDDASPDNSSLIMKEYEENFPDKIRCIYLKENIKQGGARNIGIKEAKGEYLLFVDSDDWVDITMGEKMYSKAKETDSDIVFCDMNRVWEDSLKIDYVMEVGNEISGYLTIEKQKELLSMNAYPVSKLIRRTIIVDNNIFFPEKTKYEDQAVVPFYALYSLKAGKVNEFLYKYYIRASSTVRLQNSNQHFERMDTTLMFYNASKERGFYELYKSEIDFRFIRSYYFYMLESCLSKYNKRPKDIMLQISSNMKKILPDYLSNYYVNKLSDSKHLLMAELNDISPDMLDNWETYQREQKFSYLEFYYETIERAKELFVFCEKCGYNIALWGAGQKGSEFLLVVDNSSKIVKYVIDKDVKKHGTLLPSGHLVSSFDEVVNDVNVILVSNKYHYGSVFYEVKGINNDIHVINLDYLLAYKIEVESYIN